MPSGADRQIVEIVEIGCFEHDESADRVLRQKLVQTIRIVLKIAEEAQTSRVCDLRTHLASVHVQIAADQDIGSEVGFGR